MTLEPVVSETRSLFSIVQQREYLELNAGGWRRRWRFTPFGLCTDEITISETMLPLGDTAGAEPECIYDGLSRLAYERGHDPWVPLSLESVEQDDEFSLRATWHDDRQGLRLSREWRLLDDVEAWITHASVCSEAAPQLEFGRGDYFNVIDTLPLDLSHWRARIVRFYGQTDYQNVMVAEEEFVVLPGSTARGLRGNLLFLESPDSSYGVFVLHEAPSEGEKRLECDCDFLVGPDGVRVLGWGVAPHEILPDRPRHSYSVAIGVYHDGVTRSEALRRYLKARSPQRLPERAVVANPWGDRRCYENLSEAFVLKELEACAELGITHYQIDDGWQAGGLLSDLCVHNWARDTSFWKIHPEKFPRGFGPLAARARELGVQLALWFAPDLNRHYRNWREDRDILLDFHRRYGINLFKIDAVWLRTKEAEENIERLLRGVERESGGQVRFNLDVTAGQRLGYFANLDFGSLFIENRYVTTGYESEKVYAPHQTLRNFWRLARYVPPEKMQFEAPNVAKMAACLRDEGDPLNSIHYPADYIAAVTLFCSPLIWCEPSGLPAETRGSWKRVFALHHQIRDELAAGYTFPIGHEPTGRTWTGFQSYQLGNPQSGLLLVFREWNEQASHTFVLHHAMPNARVRLSCLSHAEPEERIVTDSSGGLTLRIPDPRDFRLYRYEIED